MKKKSPGKKNYVAKDLVENGLYRPKVFVDRKKKDRSSIRKEDFESSRGV